MALLSGCSAAPTSLPETSSPAGHAGGSREPFTAPLKSAAGDARQSCTVLLESSQSITGGYDSPWVVALQIAEPYAALAARKDPTWQSLASDLTSMEAAQPPGTQLPPSSPTPQQVNDYWSNYEPLIRDCAVAGVVLPQHVPQA